MGNINPNCFVKWSVSGGTVAGKVQKVHNSDFTFNGDEVKATDDKQVAEILLPGDQTVVAVCSALTTIDEVSYNTFVTELAAKLLKDSGASYMSEAEVLAMKNELAEAKAQAEAAKASLAKANAETDVMKTECAELKAKYDQMASEADAARAEIAKFQKDKMAAARFAEAAKANFVDLFGETEDQQKASLAELSDGEWSLAMKMGGRLTDQTKTSQPKLTDQTKTSETKLTDAKASLDMADVEDNKDKDAAAIAANTAPQNLALAVSKVFSKKTDRKNSKNLS